MGVESMNIMPLPYYEDDQREYLLRTEFSNLASVEWWQSLGIDAVVLYSWGAPRYRNIARAIRKAGIRLVLHMDSSGDFVGCFREGTPVWQRAGRWLRAKLEDVFRSMHMRQADVITMCPTAAAAVSHLPFFGKWVEDRCYPMPCPVSPACAYDGQDKEDVVLCVGRWDDEFQKRPEMLMSTLERYYSAGGTAESRIFGRITESLRNWYTRLPFAVASKIRLLGYIANHQLWEEYRKARVILCTSRFESSHIVSAEALCCGCSVVTPPRLKQLRDLVWYTGAESGTIAPADTPDALAAALRVELALWETGFRNPDRIALHWQPHFHVDKVFNNIFK